MLETLKELDEELWRRYKTLERNIKSQSNSFYDAYLSLVESSLKHMLQANNVYYDDTRTCGYIIKTNEVREFLLDQLKLNQYTYDKLIDYIKKSNDHKHKKEKNVSLETIINHQKIYFDFIQSYFKYVNKTFNEKFSEEYYLQIFGITLKENNQYRITIENLKDELKEIVESKNLSDEDLEKYKKLLSINKINLLSLEEQNDELQKQIQTLQEIKLNSLEIKLNKALSMLSDLKDYVAENRIANSLIYKIICGKDITKDLIEQEKEKLYNK